MNFFLQKIKKSYRTQTFEEYIFVPNILSSKMPAVAWQPLVIIDFHYMENSSINFSFSFPRRMKITRVWKRTRVWETITELSTISVSVCTICIRRYKKGPMNLAENQRQNIVCLSRKQCLQVYLSHRNGEKCWLWAYLSADAAILPLPALWCFDCTDMNAARTEEILCWTSLLVPLPSLAVHPSIEKTCLPVDILTISYRHVSLKAFFSVL